MKLFFRLMLFNVLGITTYATSMQPQPHWFKKPIPVPRRSVAQVLHQDLQKQLNQMSAFAVTLANDINRLRDFISQKDEIINLQRALIQAYELKNNQKYAQSENQNAIILQLRVQLAQLQNTP